MSQSLTSQSIMLIGEKYKSNLVWIQIHEASKKLKEEDLRVLLRDIKTHIMKNRIKSGSVRKFKAGKLLFYEYKEKFQLGKPIKIYSLYTWEQNVGAAHKKALQLVADRCAGYSIYSAKRFFNEMMDHVDHPKSLSRLELTEEEVIERIDKSYSQAYDVNELGQIIFFLTRSEKLDWDTIEKIYIHVYESIQTLLHGSFETDPDEFLDAAYIVARAYEQIDNYPLGLELLKYIALVSAMNQRFNLETACKLRIAIIYKKYFPPSGADIIEAMSTIADLHILESAKPQKETYYSLMGYAHSLEENYEEATTYYQKAIDEAGINISSPIWIAEAYNYKGDRAKNEYNLLEAARLYLTAATIAFADGEIAKAEYYRNNAANTAISTSNIYIKSAISSRMEKNIDDSEYRTWISMRFLIRSFFRATPSMQIDQLVLANEIVKDADVIFKLSGKLKQNKSFIDKFQNFLGDLKQDKLDSKRIEKRMEEIEKTIESNIIVPSPTFMLITLDGQLVLMGKIEGDSWVKSDIKGGILGGILVAIMSLIKEVSGKTSLRTIDAGDFKIMIERSENGVVAFLLDRDISEYRARLQSILNYIDDEYSTSLRFWKGNKKVFYPLRKKVIELISQN